MTPDMAHLQRRGLTYYCVVAVPRPLQPVLKKPKLVRSLKTRDLTEAQKRRRRVLVEFDDIIDAARKGRPRLDLGTPDRDLIAEAMELRRWGATLDEYAPVDLSDAAMIRAKEIAQTAGQQTASAFYRTAVGAGTPIMLDVDAWLAESRYKPRSQQQHRGTLNEFVEWCRKADVMAELEAITRAVAGRFIREATAAKVDPATTNRKLSTFRAYWRWLVARGTATENPWKGQSLPKKRAVDSEDDEDNRTFTPAEMWRLLTGKPDPELHDFMTIAALSGMRIESIAQLRVKDCAGGVFDIRRDKTAAGTRKVPIHSALAPIISRRSKGRSPADWLFPDCSPTSRDERSSAVTKRFATYRRKRNVDDVPEGRRNSRVNFHSFRRWFITEAVRVDPSKLDVVRQIVGHKQQGMTMGVYFGGFELDAMRRVVESVKLPTEPPEATAEPAREELTTAAP